MSLSPGTRLGPYEIVSRIGEGGMGEVYRGTDTRLGRTVAIKVVKSEFSQRFEREARAVAALNHPNICALYDIGENFLAMEFIEGQPLSGPLPLDKAIGYAKQILDALEAAHRKGIVHRDLKPANILLTKSGVKLLDFGLAKIDQTKALAASDETVTQMMSQEGAIAGTLQYMAPEQLQGKEVDTRADIFAFGCVLHEILTGSQAFQGENAASVITNVMSSDPPPVSAVTTIASPALDRIVRICLAKDPDNRWQTANDLRTALDWVFDVPTAAPLVAPVSSKRNVWPAAVAAALVLGVAGGWVATRGSSSAPAPFLRFDLAPPPGVTIIDVPSVSPDGKTVAFVGVTDANNNMIYLRSLDAPGARVLPGTEGALFAFWSPDGRSLGFSTRTGFKRIDLAGGSARVLSTLPHGSQNGTWNEAGDILFYPFGTAGESGISKISASGGPISLVTRIDSNKGEGSHRFPQFLPDGKHFLFFAFGRDGTASKVELATLGSFDRKTILQGTSAAIYARGPRSEGYLLYARDENLLAQRFDESAGTVSGEPFVIADDVAGSGAESLLPTVSVSSTGTLVYHPGVMHAPGSLAWYDRHGKQLSELPAAAAGQGLALSTDDRMVAVERWDPGTRDWDIWATDLSNNATARITFGPGASISPVWSPDHTKIAFHAVREGKAAIVIKRMATGNESILRDGGRPESWSPDGKFILASGEGRLFRMVPTEGGPAVDLPVPQIARACFSPDGKFIAIVSFDRQVYVVATPPAVGKWQISTNGGYQPQWRHDGKELFFLSPDGTLMAAGITPAPSFRADAPQALFGTRFQPRVLNVSNAYAPWADGQRFLVSVREDEASTPLSVLINWTALLKK